MTSNTKGRHRLMPHISSYSKSVTVNVQHQPLYIKYKPVALAEVMGHQTSIQKVQDFLLSYASLHKTMNCAGPSGIGMNSTISIIVKEMGMTVKLLSCASGLSEVSKVLKENMRNVLFALQQIKTNLVYLITEFDALNRSDKSSLILILAEVKHAHCIVLSCNPIPSLTCVNFYRPSDNEILEHLYWIASEENMSINHERLLHISSFQDVRTCINALEGPHVYDRDSVAIEPYLTCLYAHETLQGSFEDVSTMVDLLSDIHLCEYKPTREWFTEVTSEYCNAHFSISSKQTFVARNAQICNRTKQLHEACRLLDIHYVDMHLYGYLFKKSLLCGEMDRWSERDPSYAKRNRSLYVISKRLCKISESKVLKSILKC